MFGGAVRELVVAVECGAGAGTWSWVVEVEEVVVVAVDVADDSCGTAVDECDVNCDIVTGEGSSVVEMVGMVSGSRWDGVAVGIRTVIVFFGHSLSNAMQRCSQVSFCVTGRTLHHRCASERVFRCSSNARHLVASVTSAAWRANCSILYRKSWGSSCS